MTLVKCSTELYPEYYALRHIDKCGAEMSSYNKEQLKKLVGNASQRTINALKARRSEIEAWAPQVQRLEKLERYMDCYVCLIEQRAWSRIEGELAEAVPVDRVIEALGFTPESFVGRIDEVLENAVDGDRRRVIERSFGLRDHEPVSYRVIGQELGISSSRVGQLIYDGGRAIRRWVFWDEQKKNAENLPIMERDISVFEFSPKVDMILRHNRVNTIGQLVEATRRGLLRRSGALSQQDTDVIISALRRYELIPCASFEDGKLSQVDDDFPVALLPLSTRSCNSLLRSGIYTVGQVVELIHDHRLRRVRYLGKNSAGEILALFEKG